MELLRVWRKHLTGAAAAAVVIPAAILVAALGVGVAGGGLSGLGSLGQTLTGPDIPSLEPDTATAEGELSGRLLARSLPGPDARTPRTASGGEGGRRAAGRDETPVTRRPPGGDGPRGDGPGDDGPGSPRPPSEPPRPPEPEPTPHPIRQVGEEIKRVTDQVPGAGEPAGRVVDAVVETVEALPVPGLPARRAADPFSGVAFAP